VPNPSTTKVSTPKEFANRVRAYREREGLSQEELAKRLGISRNYVSMIEGGRAPSDQVTRHFELLELAPAAGALPRNSSVTEEPSPYGKSLGHPLHGVPLVSWAQAMETENLIAITDQVEWAEFVSADIRDPKAVAVRIRGDFMEPIYKEGDIAILACSSEPSSGDLVVGRLKQEGLVFKMFQVLDVDAGRYRLNSFNPHYDAIERLASDFLWLYPVHSVIKKLMQ
jgi:phage repressor protein C with HTH and peptisase S24 domain